MTDKEYAKKVFAERLKTIMDENGITADDFEDAGICSESSIRYYLSGKNAPNLRTAYAIARFLGVSLDDLCGDDNYAF